MLSSCQSSFEVATIPAPVNLSSCNVSGWVLKRKNFTETIPHDTYDRKIQEVKKSLLGCFNKRFFWMDFSINLVYYAEEPSAKRVAFIPFSRLRGVSAIHDPVKINEAKSGWVYGVTVKTMNRTLDLWAKTEKEQQMWVDAFQKALIHFENTSSMVSFSRGPASVISFASEVQNENSSKNNVATSEKVVSPILASIKEHIPKSAITDNWSEEGEEGEEPLAPTKTKWDDWDN
jgi:Meiotic cell cortex C-terminal pleckstrin homology